MFYFLYSNFLGSQWRDAGLCFVGTLSFSCLLGFLRRLIVAVEWLRFLRGWSAVGICDVVLVAFLLKVGFLGDDRCDGMSLVGEF